MTMAADFIVAFSPVCRLEFSTTLQRAWLEIIVARPTLVPLLWWPQILLLFLYSLKNSSKIWGQPGTLLPKVKSDQGIEEEWRWFGTYELRSSHQNRNSGKMKTNTGHSLVGNSW